MVYAKFNQGGLCKKNPFGLANNNVARIIVIFLFCDAHNSRIIVGAGAPLGERVHESKRMVVFRKLQHCLAWPLSILQG